MHTYHRCTVCYRDIIAKLSELYIHCDAYHYGQSPDLIFPHHGLHYKPMDMLLKRELTVRGERKMGAALLTGSATIAPSTPQMTYVVVKPQIDIQHDPDPRLAIEDPVALQMRVLHLSSAWEALVCQGWVTTKTEAQANGDDIAIMEKC